MWVWGTIPAGSGTNIITVSIDGNSSGSISHTSNGSAVYNEQYFASPLLTDTFHTLEIINQGSTTSGNSEFMLDRFEFETDDAVPVFSPFPSTSSVSSSSTSNPSSYVPLSSSSAASTLLLSSSQTSRVNLILHSLNHFVRPLLRLIYLSRLCHFFRLPGFTPVHPRALPENQNQHHPGVE